MVQHLLQRNVTLSAPANQIHVSGGLTLYGERCISTVYLTVIMMNDKIASVALTFQRCKSCLSSIKPLCRGLASDKPLNALICHHRTFWIIFHCLTGALNSAPPLMQPPVAF